jgi:hypothetical protein
MSDKKGGGQQSGAGPSQGGRGNQGAAGGKNPSVPPIQPIPKPKFPDPHEVSKKEEPKRYDDFDKLSR